MDMQNRNCKTSDNVGLVAAGIFYLELGFARSPLLQLLANFLGTFTSLALVPGAFEDC